MPKDINSAFSAQDRAVIRDLAKLVADIARDPVMDERRTLWADHNSLRPGRPLILISPEGSWDELIPAADIRCTSESAKTIERNLRMRIYQHEHFADDSVIEATWGCGAVIHSSGWGLEEQTRTSSHLKGARAFVPVLNSTDDLKRLHYPVLQFDKDRTQQNMAFMQELFGDILTVFFSGASHISFHLMQLYTGWRGLDQTFLDMCLNPDMIHDAMAILTEGHARMLEFYEKENILRPNNNNTYHSSGGNGFCDQLPAPGFDPSHVRPCDMWASAESQEMAPVSPEQHWEFVMQYESRLLAHFGLNGYGCCEDLTHKLDDVCAMPNMRRISVSPWADVDACAKWLKEDFIFSWKPHPAHLCGNFNEEKISAYISHAVDACLKNRCVMEIILKDTHTCENQVDRFDRWTRIARQCVDAAIQQM